VVLAVALLLGGLVMITLRKQADVPPVPERRPNEVRTSR
jgi:hypothetical protein